MMKQLFYKLTDLNNDGGNGGLEIIIHGTLGSPEDDISTPIYLEYYKGKLFLRVWNGKVDPEVIEIKLKEKSHV